MARLSVQMKVYETLAGSGYIYSVSSLYFKTYPPKTWKNGCCYHGNGNSNFEWKFEKWKFCYHLLTLMSFWNHKTFVHLQKNTLIHMNRAV